MMSLQLSNDTLAGLHPARWYLDWDLCVCGTAFACGKGKTGGHSSLVMNAPHWLLSANLAPTLAAIYKASDQWVTA